MFDPVPTVSFQMPLNELLDQVTERLKPFLKEVLETSSKNGGSNTTDDLLTIQQAAKYLSLSVSTLYSRSDIPSMKKGKRLYYSKNELNAWLKTGKIKTEGEIDAEVDATLSNHKASLKTIKKYSMT